MHTHKIHINLFDEFDEFTNTEMSCDVHADKSYKNYSKLPKKPLFVNIYNLN